MWPGRSRQLEANLNLRRPPCASDSHYPAHLCGDKLAFLHPLRRPLCSAAVKDSLNEVARGSTNDGTGARVVRNMMKHIVGRLMFGRPKRREVEQPRTAPCGR